jgi:hypothetical protein
MVSNIDDVHISIITSCISDNTVYLAAQVPNIHACALQKKPTELIAAWSCMVTYDTIAIALAIINALDRPRRNNADIILYFKGDGALFFMVCTPLLNPKNVLTCFRLSLVCLCRIIINLRLTVCYRPQVYRSCVDC